MEMTNYRPTDGFDTSGPGSTSRSSTATGHLTEFLPLLPDRLTELAGESAAQRSDALVHSGQKLQGVNDHVRNHRIIRSRRWGISTSYSLDRATALCPRQHYARLDELGHESLYKSPPDLAAVH
jgi:hypothetical protein